MSIMLFYDKSNGIIFHACQCRGIEAKKDVNIFESKDVKNLTDNNGNPVIFKDSDRIGQLNVRENESGLKYFRNMFDASGKPQFKILFMKNGSKKIIPISGVLPDNWKDA